MIALTNSQPGIGGCEVIGLIPGGSGRRSDSSPTPAVTARLRLSVYALLTVNPCRSRLVGLRLSLAKQWVSGLS